MNKLYKYKYDKQYIQLLLEDVVKFYGNCLVTKMVSLHLHTHWVYIKLIKEV